MDIKLHHACLHVITTSMTSLNRQLKIVNACDVKPPESTIGILSKQISTDLFI